MTLFDLLLYCFLTQNQVQKNQAAQCPREKCTQSNHQYHASKFDSTVGAMEQNHWPLYHQLIGMVL